MQEQLIIFLDAHDLHKPSWVVKTTSISAVVKGNVEELQPLSLDKEVVIVVPAEDVLILNAKLPKMNRGKLEQALPFSLEEQLICDIDKLHFAPAEYQSDGTLPVAIVAKEKLQVWLALLQGWDVTADKMLPTSMLVNWAENQWNIVVAEFVLLRMGKFNVMVCDKSNLREVLEIAFATSAMMPEQLHIHNYTSNSIIPNLFAAVKMQEEFCNADDINADLTKNYIDAGINLLQGAYSPKKSKLPQARRLWRYAAMLIASWVAILYLYPLFSFFILQHKASELSAEIAATYQRNFPMASDMSEPKLHMQEKLQKINSELEQNKYLLILGYLGKGLEQAKGVNFKRLDYQDGRLTVELLAATSDEFSSFTDYLSQQGLSVKQQNAKLNGAHISATLVVE